MNDNLNSNLKDTLFLHCQSLQRYLKKEYEEHLVVTDRGITFHDPCINHCLLYAFGECDVLHTYTCNKCQEVFKFFEDLKTNLDTYHDEIQEHQDRLLYYIAHRTRKVYLNAQFNRTR